MDLEAGASTETRGQQGGAAEQVRTREEEPVRREERPLSFSIVIPCRDEGGLLKATLDSIARTEGARFTVTVVDDGSTDESCAFLQEDSYRWVTLLRGEGKGPARARNLGAAALEGDVVVFCDAHVSVPPDWLARFEAHFRDAGVAALSPAIAAAGEGFRRVGYGLTWDSDLESRWLSRPETDLSEVPLLPSGCLAIRRQVFHDAEGFNRGFRGYGSEDVELSLRLWLFGHRLYCARDVLVDHRFRERQPYLVSLGEVYHNLIRMALTHFNEERIARCLYRISRRIDPTRLIAHAICDGTTEDRRRWQERRIYSDDWFMRRFSIDL